jgi:Big-like domain-containing protein
MNERVAISQVNSSQLANLVRSHIVKVTKPQSEQAITLDLNDGAGAKLDVELSAGRTLNGEQFAQSVPITDDQPVLPANDPSSGADFRDVSIDSLPGSMSPLALITQEMSGAFGHGSSDMDADFGVVAHAQILSTSAPTVVGSAPIITIPPPGGAGTQVFEAGLLASRGLGESAGTHAGSPAFQTTTRPGTINFTSPNGLDSVTLGGVTLHVGDTKTIADGTTGILTASLTSDAIHYTYTLLDNTLAVPTASFALVVIDANHVPTVGGNLVINIVDDAPRAIGDTDHVSARDPSTDGNVIDGTGTTSGVVDVAGADGGLHVVGIAFGNTGGALGVPLSGANGTLTIDAQGNYTYTRTGSGTAPDVFTYRVADADGTESTSQLTIAVDNAAPGGFTFPTATTPGVTEVFEAGLLASRGVGESAGSDAGNLDGKAPTQATGSITFTSFDGVGSIKLFDDAANPNNPIISLDSGHQSQTFIDPAGLYTLLVSYTIVNGAGTFTYTYTLNDNTSGAAANTHFTLTVADTNGDSASGDLVIAIQDDGPSAKPDTDFVAANQAAVEHGDVVTGSGTTSGVVGADVLGADGPTAPNNFVVGVAAGPDSGTPVNGSVGTQIQGLFGKLTLFADGHYDYARDFGEPGGPVRIDTFHYTIGDADGSHANATLTITLADSTPGGFQVPTIGDSEAIVFEAGLPERIIGGVKESAGSNPADQIDATGTIGFWSASATRRKNRTTSI